MVNYFAGFSNNRYIHYDTVFFYVVAAAISADASLFFVVIPLVLDFIFVLRVSVRIKINMQTIHDRP